MKIIQQLKTRVLVFLVHWGIHERTLMQWDWDLIKYLNKCHNTRWGRYQMLVYKGQWLDWLHLQYKKVYRKDLL